jgi:hypothetical protein
MWNPPINYSAYQQLSKKNELKYLRQKTDELHNARNEFWDLSPYEYTQKDTGCPVISKGSQSAKWST